jgi:hypothetical protein
MVRAALYTPVTAVKSGSPPSAPFIVHIAPVVMYVERSISPHPAPAAMVEVLAVDVRSEAFGDKYI